MTTTISWTPVTTALTNAKGIAFDGCHKIYVLLDDEQMTAMVGYGYGEDDGTSLIPVTDVEAALSTVQGWFFESCGLRFIDSIATNDIDANAGFTTLIGQFEYEQTEDTNEDDLDED